VVKDWEARLGKTLQKRERDRRKKKKKKKPPIASSSHSRRLTSQDSGVGKKAKKERQTGR